MAKKPDEPRHLTVVPRGEAAVQQVVKDWWTKTVPDALVSVNPAEAFGDLLVASMQVLMRDMAAPDDEVARDEKRRIALLIAPKAAVELRPRANPAGRGTARDKQGTVSDVMDLLADYQDPPGTRPN